jgi:hypothetical protein
VTLTFECFVIKADLNKAISQQERLASVLGASSIKLDWDSDSAITRNDWRDFVVRLHVMAAKRQA